MLLAGCGSESSTPASVVPADSAFYVSVDSDARFPGTGDPLGVVLASTGAGAADVRPWIGDGAAIFGSPDGLGIVLRARDEAAAEGGGALTGRPEARAPRSVATRT